MLLAKVLTVVEKVIQNKYLDNIRFEPYVVEGSSQLDGPGAFVVQYDDFSPPINLQEACN